MKILPDAADVCYELQVSDLNCQWRTRSGPWGRCWCWSQWCWSWQGSRWCWSSTWWWPTLITSDLFSLILGPIINNSVHNHWQTVYIFYSEIFCQSVSWYLKFVHGGRTHWQPLTGTHHIRTPGSKYLYIEGPDYDGSVSFKLPKNLFMHKLMIGISN